MGLVGNKKLLLIIIGGGVICILFIVVLMSVFQKPGTTNPKFVTPTPIHLNTSSNNTNVIPTTVIRASDQNQQFTIQYPSSFTQVVNSDPNDDSITLLFSQDNHVYHFLVSPPGQINPEGDETTRVENTDVQYAGQAFTRELWMKGNTPFFITAIPKDTTAIPYFFSMQLPPTDTNQYITVFGNIVNSYSQRHE